jgi:hypothetical protein
MVKVFEDNLICPRPHERALALVALCVGGMVLARNVCDSAWPMNSAAVHTPSC